MYKLMIVEDERIERESLQEMIRSFAFPIDEIITAENGEEGLQKYRLFHPNIILADINMPILGGLDMVECIRQKDTKVMCLILTSYDYFSYAQRAIRLHVEDFILKPADSVVLHKSLVQVMEKMMKNQNTYCQTSSLVKKMNEMKALLESECFYAIMTKQNEFKLLNTLRMANIIAISCCCVVFEEKGYVANLLMKFRNEIEDIGYMGIQGDLNHQHILFILVNRKMTESDRQVILHILQQNPYRDCVCALGSFQNEISTFYQSYEDAKYNLNNQDDSFYMSSFAFQEDDIDLQFSLTWVQRIMDSINSDEQAVIHELCQEFLHFEYDKINKIMKLIISKMILLSNRQYQLGIEESDVSFDELKYYNYQNLEIIVAQLLNQIIKPVRNMKYYNSSSLIKKSMEFIEKNYASPISLNTLSKKLNVSPFYISKLFSKELGRNFTDVVNDIRIKKAKQLIRKDTPFKEVAYLIGFGSQSYFTKTFRKIVGMSPTDYRKLFP